jgi:hypothetical protein
LSTETFASHGQNGGKRANTIDPAAKIVDMGGGRS